MGILSPIAVIVAIIVGIFVWREQREINEQKDRDHEWWIAQQVRDGIKRPWTNDVAVQERRYKALEDELQAEYIEKYAPASHKFLYRGEDQSKPSER